jgi:hypothetical protein
MINRIPLEVTYADSRVDHVLCTGADTIAFERAYDLPTNKIGERLEYMWFLAWACLNRTKRVNLPFEDWMSSVDQVVDDESAGQTEILPLESPAVTSSSATLPMNTDSLPL